LFVCLFVGVSFVAVCQTFPSCCFEFVSFSVQLKFSLFSFLFISGGRGRRIQDEKGKEEWKKKKKKKKSGLEVTY